MFKIKTLFAISIAFFIVACNSSDTDTIKRENITIDLIKEYSILNKPLKANCSFVDSNDNIYVVGRSFDGGVKNTEVFIAKFKKDGSIIWSLEYGSDEMDFATTLVLDEKSGHLYVSGRTYGVMPNNSSFGNADIFVSKITDKGELLWTSQIGTDTLDSVSSMVQDSKKMLYLVGRTSSSFEGATSMGGTDAFVMKISSNGEVIWTNQYGTEGSDEAIAIKIDSNDDIIFVGNQWKSNVVMEQGDIIHLSNIFIQKISSDGNALWRKLIGSSQSAGANSLTLGEDNQIFIAGTASEELEGNKNDKDNQNAMLASLSSSGELIWQKQFNNASTGGTVPISMINSDDIYITGMAQRDIIVEKYTHDGDLVWSKIFGTDEQERPSGISINTNGELLVTGWSEGKFSKDVKPENKETGLIYSAIFFVRVLENKIE